MRLHIFTSSAAILCLGLASFRFLEKSQAFAFLSGALTLGGGILICGLFSLANRWHGIIGAGVVALLGAARGVVNLTALPAFLAGDRTRGPAPLLEAAVAFISLFLLFSVLRRLRAEKLRRTLAAYNDTSRRLP